jgi:hypothetical protein
MQVLAPAKINLSLKIIGRRNDGFHELDSLIAPISLYDEIKIDKRRSGKGIEFGCNDPSVPQSDENLVVRAAKAFFETTKIEPAVLIELEKKIPHGAGLGGDDWIRRPIFYLSIRGLMQGVWRNGHAHEIEEKVFDPVIEAGLWRLNRMGIFALARFSRDSRGSLQRAAIR